MIPISNELSVFSTKLKNELAAVERELKHLPSGRLSCEKQAGKYHFVKVKYINNVRKRSNLQTTDSELFGLIKKTLLESEQLQLIKNINAIESSLREIKDFDANAVLYDLRKTYPIMTEDVLSKALSTGSEGAWGNDPYEKYDYENETTKWHMSSFGPKFRSKSELLIAEKLHNAGIQFRYEEVLHLGNNMLVPDFTIKCHNGKIMYWEHEGLTNSQEYLNRQLKKSQIYALNGIVPWDNLIVTYDNAAGIIDLRIVESEIRNKLL